MLPKNAERPSGRLPYQVWTHRVLSFHCFIAATLLGCACGQVQGLPAVGDWQYDTDEWSQPETNLEDFRPVARVRDLQALIHVLGVLNSSGIGVAAGGLGGRSSPPMQVPAKQLEQALRILRADSKFNAYAVWLPLPEERQWVTQAEDVDTPVNLTYGEVLQQARYGPTTELGAVLRHPGIVKLALKYSRLVTVRSWTADVDESGRAPREVDLLFAGNEEGLEAAACLRVVGNRVLLREVLSTSKP